MKNEQLIKIEISHLSVQALIGVYAKERLQTQELIFDVVLYYDGSKAMQSDQIEDAVDYYKITKKITEIVANTHYFLLERLLDDVLSQLMQDSRIMDCQITIHKPEVLAPIRISVSNRRNKRG